MKADLHLHTTASDGLKSPRELVEMTAGLGLKVIAITDHDTVNGIEPALTTSESFPELKVIPGIEISTDVPQGEVHILGYFVDYRDPEFLKELARLRNSRKLRAQGMLAKLANLGIDIEWERVQEIAGDGSVGRPHVAQAMLEQGCISSLKEAFVSYIGRDGPAYVEREKMIPPEAVELISGSGGLPVLAHPANIDNLEKLIMELQKVGLAGIETYYASYSPQTVQQLASLTKKYGLIATGGSDYHGLDGIGEISPDRVSIPPECIERLLALGKQKERADEQGEFR